MVLQFALKKLHAAAIPAALEKAEHYRLLNDPEQAESICLDILETDPNSQAALIILVLAVADQFSGQGSGKVKRAVGYCEKLADEYHRLYYRGIIEEREGRAFLTRGHARSFAYASFVDAMDWFEKAKERAPEGNEEAVLRWNSCARTIMREKLEPPHESEELPLE